MKKIIVLCVMIASVLCFSSCSDSKTIHFVDGSTKVCEPYGFFDEDTVKDEKVKYNIVTGNVIWSIIFAETIVVPAILLGNYLYEPIESK